MELPALLRRLEGKVVSGRELGRYFDAKSLADLLLTLRQLAREGCFKFEVTLSGEYFEWERARQDLLLRKDVLIPVDPFGALQRSAYGLSVKGDTPLTEKEMIDAVIKLPTEMGERYLLVKLSDINQDKLYEFVVARHETRSVDEDEFYDREEYNGLVADGSDITYNDEPVEMRFQCRQIVRLLIQKQGRVAHKDEFTDNLAGIFNRPTYGNVDRTLTKLISEARKALEAVTKKNCIVNKPGVGWYLKIES